MQEMTFTKPKIDIKYIKEIRLNMNYSNVTCHKHQLITGCTTNSSGCATASTSASGTHLLDTSDSGADEPLGEPHQKWIFVGGNMKINSNDVI